MLVKENHEEFLKRFKKSFNNFCENTPFLLSYSIYGYHVQIVDSSPLIPDSIDFILNPNEDVKENINQIKNILKDFFPILFILQEESIEDIEKKIEQGIIRDFGYQPEQILKKMFVLERIDINKNEVVVFNLIKNKKEIRKLKMSVVFLLRKIYEGETNIAEYLITNTITTRMM